MADTTNPVADAIRKPKLSFARISLSPLAAFCDFPRSGIRKPLEHGRPDAARPHAPISSSRPRLVSSHLGRSQTMLAFRSNTHVCAEQRGSAQLKRAGGRLG